MLDCLEERPVDRPATARELERRLRAALGAVRAREAVEKFPCEEAIAAARAGAS